MQVKAYYNKVADTYLAEYKANVKDEYYINTNLRPMVQWVDLKDKHILDMGCGNGRFTKLLSQYSKAVIGIDFAKKMIENRIYPRCYHADMTNMNYYSEVFDVITAIGSMEYHDDVNLVFKEAYRLLQPGGYFIFNVHKDVAHIKLYRWITNKKYLKYNLYKLKDLKAIFKKHKFKVEHIKPTYFLPNKINSYELDNLLGCIPFINKLSCMYLICLKKS